MDEPPARPSGHLGRWLAGTPRYPPQARDLRSHSEKYPWTQSEHPLGHHAPHVAAPRLFRRIRLILECPPRGRSHLGEPVHASDRRGKRRKADSRRPPKGGPHLTVLGAEIS